MTVVPSRTWYAYTLACLDGTVFYVGKGTGNRIEVHEMEARSGCGCDKCVVIRKIWSDGNQVQKSIVMDGLTEDDALRQEKYLILNHAGVTLTNTVFNPNKKRTEKIAIRETVFPERIINGISYIAIRDLTEAFAIRKQRLDMYLHHLNIVCYRFPFDWKAYILTADLVRIQKFVQSNRS